MASIIIQTGQQQGDFYPLGQRTTVVGRNEALPIQILDEQVSRKHMQIRYSPQTGEYIAVDMNSRHGVFVNAKKVSDELVLCDNDHITIGSTKLLFTLEDFDDKDSAMHHYKKAGQRSLWTVND